MPWSNSGTGTSTYEDPTAAARAAAAGALAQQQDQQRYDVSSENALLSSFFGGSAGQGGANGRGTRAGRTGVNYRAELGALPAVMQQQNSQSRFNQLFPFLTGQFNSNSDPMQMGGQPQIDVGPIWNDQRLQQQINSQRARGDQQAQSQTQQMRQSMGSRGFGSNSPLSQALAGMYQGRNLSNQANQERETRMTAAQENAGHVFQTQMGRESALQERARPYFQRQNALLSALAGLA